MASRLSHTIAAMTLALAASVPASAAFTGHAAWYFTGGAGLCGLTEPADKLVASIATPTYNHGVNCGRTIQVSYQLNSVNVTVFDQDSVYVNPGDLLLSQTAYAILTSLNNDGITVTWDFV